MVLRREGGRWERRTVLASGESWHLVSVWGGVDMAGSLPLIGEYYKSKVDTPTP